MAEHDSAANEDFIHFQGYKLNGAGTAAVTTSLSFTIQPDLTAYASGATNHIVWQTIPSLSPYPGQSVQAIQFTQLSANNGVTCGGLERDSRRQQRHP